VVKFFLERGPTLEILENVEASGQYVETLATRPDVNLPPELMFILRQFQTLSGHRPPGMGLSAIPFTEMEAHYRIYIAPDDIMSLAEFADWITMLDDIVLEHHRKTEDDKKSKEIGQQRVRR
jgi:hypothetical protein